MVTDHAERCKKIATAVETLSQTETEELFRIIHKHRFDYTRNNHGVFINLSWVPDAVLTQMEEYIRFCHQSKHELKKYESICDALNTKIVNNHDNDEAKSRKEMRMLANKIPIAKETVETSFTGQTNGEITTSDKTSKVSASMRFYLLKKKYAKLSTISNNFESDLSHDEYKINN